MKTLSILLLSAGLSMISCSDKKAEPATASQAGIAPEQTSSGGQAAISDEVSKPNVVKVAIGSKDHTTLVAAVQAADLVNSLSNNGPFTVFAPTNAAFDALPEGTVDNLLKSENKPTLSGILEHHVYVGTLELGNLNDGQTLGMFDGSNAMISMKDGKYYIDDAAIVASVPASNGIVHVIDKVILPK